MAKLLDPAGGRFKTVTIKGEYGGGTQFVLRLDSGKPFGLEFGTP